MGKMNCNFNFNELVGKFINKIEKVNKGDNCETLIFHTEAEWSKDGDIYVMSREHSKEVYIESIVGDLNDIVGAPILCANLESNDEDKPTKEVCDNQSWLWTTYKLFTLKGCVGIKWFGICKGGYSPEVGFHVWNKKEYYNYFQSLADSQTVVEIYKGIAKYKMSFEQMNLKAIEGEMFYGLGK